MLLTKGSSFQLNAHTDVTVRVTISSGSAAKLYMFLLDQFGNALEQRVFSSNEILKLPLGNLSKHTHNVSFAVSADNGSNLREAQFDIQIKDLHVCKYVLNESITTETAFILGEFYKFGKKWRFRAVGQGYYGGLDAILKNYSVAV